MLCRSHLFNTLLCSNHFLTLKTLCPLQRYASCNLKYVRSEAKLNTNRYPVSIVYYVVSTVLTVALCMIVPSVRFITRRVFYFYRLCSRDSAEGLPY